MIAISYRREDSTPIAGRLHDRLRAEFGKENVFMDFDSIPYGVDFREHIARILEGADILVAVIGPGWLGDRGDPTRRIDDVTDFVRLEIAGALQRGIPVIPILVDKTPMPREDTLPSDLKPLVFRNALMLDTGIDFHHHVDRLIAGIRGLLRNVQSASRRASKEKIRDRNSGLPRTSPAFSRDAEDKPTASGRFKWLGVLDKLRSPAPSQQQQDQERDIKPSSQPPVAEPVTAVPNKMTALEAGPKQKRMNRPKKQSALPAGPNPPPADRAAQPAPPVPVAAAPVQQRAIALPARPAGAASSLGPQEKPQKSFFSGKLVGVVLAACLVALVAYSVVTSQMKSTSTRSLAIASSPAATPLSLPLITPAAAPSPSAEAQFTAQPAPSNTLVVDSSATPVDQPTGSQLPADNTTSAVVNSSPSSTPPTIVTQPGESNYQTNKSPPSADEETVRQFVRDYYAALSSRDLDAIVSKFSDAVDYQGQGHHDRKYIRTDMANYFRRWDKIVFDGGDISVSRNGDGSFVVSFNFPFAVAKGLSPEKRGFSSQVWVLREEPPGNLQIVSQREKVIAGRSKQRKSRH